MLLEHEWSALCLLRLGLGFGSSDCYRDRIPGSFREGWQITFEMPSSIRGLQCGPHDKQAAVEAAWPSCLSILMLGHVRSVVQACFRRVRSKSRETCRT